MSSIFYKLIILQLCVICALSKCEYRSFDPFNPPVFTTTIHETEIIFKNEGSSITIGEGSELNAYCSLNFSTPFKTEKFSPPLYLDRISVHCLEGSLYYLTNDGKKLNNVELHPPLKCLRTIFLNQAESSFCKKQSIVFSLDNHHVPLYLSDVCFDMDTLETKLIHYGTSPLGSLTHPELFAYTDLISTDFIQSNSMRTIKLNQSIHKNWPKFYKLQGYRFDELVPTRNLLRGFEAASNITAVISIPWWEHLKNGNWKLVEEITDQITTTNYFDIYTGTLHLDEMDVELDLNSFKYLHFTMNNQRQKIPLFVWKYLKPMDPFDVRYEVVLIAINYPFLTDQQVQQLTFCRNICEEYSWLRDLTIRRHYPGFGYVFCCKANEARDTISIIHKIQLAFRNELTIEEL